MNASARVPVQCTRDDIYLLRRRGGQHSTERIFFRLFYSGRGNMFHEKKLSRTFLPYCDLISRRFKFTAFGQNRQDSYINKLVIGFAFPER